MKRILISINDNFFLFHSILKFDENEHYKLERTIFKINIKFRTFKNSKISKIQNFSTHVHNIFHMMIYLEIFIKNTTQFFLCAI